MIDNKRSRAVDLLILLFAYFLVSSAAFSGFFGKWQFRDEAPKFSVAQMLDGTADRPYVYRQLMPAVVNKVASLISPKTQENIRSHLADDFPQHNAIAKIYSGSKYAADPDYQIRYYFLYTFSFLALFSSLLLLRAVLLELKSTKMAATVAPLIFALLFPMISTHGGYFYDFPEIGFMAAGVLLALRGKLFALIVLTALATFNKESYVFFAIALFPFLRTKLTLRRALLSTGLLVVTASVVNFLVKAHFSKNGGGLVEIHFLENLKAYIRPATYFHFEWTYGILFPQGMNILTILLLCFVVQQGRSRLASVTRQHLGIAAVLNIPLFLLFCAYDELRNFSLLYISFISLIACGLDRYLAQAASEIRRGEAGSTQRPMAPEID